LVIIKLKARVKRLEKANMVKSSKLRRLRKVRASTQVESSDAMEDVLNQGRMIDDMDKDEGIELVKDAEVAESEESHAAQQAEKQAEIYNLDLDHSSKVLSIQEDDSKVQDVVEVVTTAKLITKVVTAAASQVSAASATIPAVKPSIPTAAPTVVAAYTRRRKGVFANMRRVGKGFSGVETPPFEGMLVVRQPTEEEAVEAQVQVDAAVEENVTEDVAHDTIPSPLSHDIPSPTLEPSLPPQQQQSSPQAPPQGAEFPSQLQ
nr:hypothetical protein [Tanacetum cinerariifolium]